MGDYSFNADEVPESSFAILPPGWYAAVIEDTAYKQTKSGANNTEIKFRIDENKHPEFGGRILFSRIFWDGVKDVAIDISRQNLASICRAVNQRTLADKYHPNELLARRIAIHVKVRAAQMENGAEKYPEQNEIKGYDSIAARFDGQAPPAQSAASQGNAQPAGAAPSRSWRKS